MLGFQVRSKAYNYNWMLCKDMVVKKYFKKKYLEQQKFVQSLRG